MHSKCTLSRSASKLVATFALLLLFVATVTGRGAASTPAYHHSWSQGFGDAQRQSGDSVAIDPAGNIVVTGGFVGTIDLGGGPLTSAGGSDIFVAKFDAAGNHLWSQRFGDADSQYGQSMAVDAAGNVVLTGYFSSTVDFGGGPLISDSVWNTFVAKLDAAGNHLWSERFRARYPEGITVDAAGDIVVTGSFDNIVDFGGGPLTSAGYTDIFVAKFDAAGNHLWSQRFGDADHQSGMRVAVDAAGNIMTTGSFEGTVDFGGGPLTSAGSYDIFVATLDTAGNHLWSKRFGDASGDQYAMGIAVDAAGNVALTGHFSGTIDFGGGPLVAAGSYDIFVARFDAVGNHLLGRRFGGDTSWTIQGGNGIATDTTGNVVITGFFEGTVDFGGGPLTSAGTTDIFLARLVIDTDDDGCSDEGEPLLVPATDPANPWDFFSVPVPALYAAPNPLVVFADSTVGAADAQAIFAYFKEGARTGKPVYEQDLNTNGIADGIEYDRSVAGPAMSGAPDGVVTASDAQLAFAQFKFAYHC